MVRYAVVSVFLCLMSAGTVHAQDWEEQSQMEEDYANGAQEAPVHEEYVQEEYVQEEYVQEETYEEPQYDSGEQYQQQEYVQEEQIQDEYVQEEPVQEEYVQEEPQYEQQEYPAEIPPDLEWAQQQGAQCMESADADGLDGEEREEFMRSCMQP